MEPLALVKHGFNNIVVQSVATDASVLAGCSNSREDSYVIDIWIAFGTEKDLHYAPARVVSASL